MAPSKRIVNEQTETLDELSATREIRVRKLGTTMVYGFGSLNLRWILYCLVSMSALVGFVVVAGSWMDESREEPITTHHSGHLRHLRSTLGDHGGECPFGWVTTNVYGACDLPLFPTILAAILFVSFVVVGIHKVDSYCDCSAIYAWLMFTGTIGMGMADLVADVFLLFSYDSWANDTLHWAGIIAVLSQFVPPLVAGFAFTLKIMFCTNRVSTLACNLYAAPFHVFENVPYFIGLLLFWCVPGLPITLALMVVWYALWLLAIAICMITKLVLIEQVVETLLVYGPTINKYGNKEYYFNLKYYTVMASSFAVFSELFLETTPMLVIASINIFLTQQFSLVAVAPIVVGALFVLHHIRRFWRQCANKGDFTPEFIVGIAPVNDGLWAAIHSGDLEKVRETLSRKVDIERKRGFGDDARTPLAYAAEKGDVELCSLLIQHGADVSSYRSEPYKFAIKSNHMDVLKLLLDNGLSVSDAMWNAILCRSSLAIEFLVEKGADVNEDVSALHIAAIDGNVRLATILFRKGAKVNPIDEYYGTPLHVAAEHGHIDFIQLLLDNGADPTIQDRDGRTALQVAERENQHTAVQVLSIHNAAKASAQRFPEAASTNPFHPSNLEAV